MNKFLTLKYILLAIVFYFIASHTGLLSQCNLLTPLEVINPSFEGPPGKHVTPAPWSTCGITPDTQPGFWGVNLPASNGNTYVGFVNGGVSWLEGASQQLNGNMQAGVPYQLTIDLASTNSTGGGINPAPASIEIYGANGICTTTELLWSSPVINHLNWQTYTVTFTPTQNWSHIYFRISASSPHMSYLLLDNITPIFAQEPNIFITSHQPGANINCSINLAGNITHTITDSVVLTGNFVGSPLTASLNGLNWSANLNFNSGGNQTITATAYYNDPVNGAVSCVYTAIDLNVNAPTANFSFQNGCQNDTLSFIDNSSPFGNSTIVNWSWDFGDGNSSSIQNPSHAYTSFGSYNVTLSIVSSDGCNTSLSQTLDVYDLPNTSFYSDTTCYGDTTFFQNNSTVTNGVLTSWIWNFGDGNNSNIENPFNVYTSPGDYNVNLTTTSSYGCSSSTNLSTSVLSLPNIEFSANDNCLNEITNFYDSTNTSNGNMTSWLWNFGDGNTSSIQNPSHLYSSPGTYTVQLISSSNYGCTDSISHSVTIHSLPIANFYSNQVCANSPTSLWDSSTVVNSSISLWRWDVFNNNSIDFNTQNGNYIFTTGGDFDVELYVESTYGCTDSIVLPVTVHYTPSPNFTSDSACFGLPTTLTDLSSVTNSSISQWLWIFGDGNTGNGNPTTNIYPDFGFYNVNLTVTSSFGCDTSITDSVYIHPLPQPNFSNTTVCVNTPPTSFLDSTSIPQGAISQLNWNFGDGNSGNGTTPSNTYQNEGTYNVTLTAISTYGCIDSTSQEVIVYEKPTAMFTSNVTQICNPDSIHFINTSSSNSTTINSLQWNFFNGITSIESSPTIGYTNEFATPLLFDVELIAENNYGCYDTILIADYIQVIPTPEADFSFTPENPTILKPEIEFTNSSIFSDEYFWSFGDGNTSITINPTHTYSFDATNYTIELIAYNYGKFCSDTTTAEIIIEDVVILYVPNTFTPDGDEYNNIWKPIFTSGYDPYNIQIEIFNRWGEKIWESHDLSIGWDGTYLGGANLVEDGVYTWKITFKESKTDKKHVKTGHVTVIK